MNKLLKVTLITAIMATSGMCVSLKTLCTSASFGAAVGGASVCLVTQALMDCHKQQVMAQHPAAYWHSTYHRYPTCGIIGCGTLCTTAALGIWLYSKTKK